MKFYNFRFSLRVKIRLLKSILSIVNSGVFVGGPKVEEFEKEFSKKVGSSTTVSCGNGLDALRLAIRDSNLPKNSKIAVSAHTFFASWLAIIEEGHIPIGIDAHITNGQMNPQVLEAVLSTQSDIKAVIYVHMHGIAGPIEQISEICSSRRIVLIEDCAQAHGLIIAGRHVGTFGDYGSFSFYPTKNLPALGDAGCVVTHDKNERKLRALANYGWLDGNRDKHYEIGINSRLDAIQASVLLNSMRDLYANNRKRKQIAKKYISALHGAEDIKLLSELNYSVWHHFPLLVEKRSQFIDFLEERGIKYQIHYPTPCHLQPIMQELNLSSSFQEGDFPVAEYISNHIISLPLNPWLKSKHINRIVDAINDWKLR